ncbi:sugar transferase [Paragemmobacter ruber]|uniref:Sugar transferase n=1 Tax=Paragemmobacter ruber TaxID=1985673 RepID=A0ABW9Y236_9RHOB|nr:sugar transferase [Rhodobacter ruber]NBE06568.1 sugar transferase [Rhodobacter ruber]
MSTRIHDGLTDFDRSKAANSAAWTKRRGFGLYRNAGKRVLDILLVIVVLPFVLPLVGMLALLVARDGHSPFYKQERVGRDGRVFKLWKLRTMVPDAKAHLEAYLAENETARQEWDAYQKLTCDPRITVIGHVLRKSSLDELPQLWNVLKGDMSLVGPRPMMTEQRALYPGNAYFSLRPGLTGLWQVSDRNESTFAQRADFDAEYEQKLSLFTDVKVMFATVGVVLRCTGH